MKTRRQFIHTGIATTVGTAVEASSMGQWRSLFDGETLAGWRAIPRLGAHKVLREAGPLLTRENLEERNLVWHRANGTPQEILNHTGEWKVEDGAIVGGQSPAGCRHGAYLITDRTFANFEMEYEMRPDWRTDTGVLIRQHSVGTIGFQVLCDHRPNGGIGGIYANGLGSYLAAPFFVDGDDGENFEVENFRKGEFQWAGARGRMESTVDFDGFREVWKVNQWNRFRVRCVGANPVITTWINGLEIGTLDSSDPGVENYDASMIQRLVGTAGHIGLEVHSNTPGRGWDQWARGAVSRWRNIRVREIT